RAWLHRYQERSLMSTVGHLRKRLSGFSGVRQSFAATRAFLRRHLWLWPLIAAVLFGSVGWWVHRRVEGTMREVVAAHLTTTLDAEVAALRTWAGDQAAVARSLARLPGLRPAVRGLLTANTAKLRAGRLPQTRELAECRSLLRPHLENFGYTHFYVVSP